MYNPQTGVEFEYVVSALTVISFVVLVIALRERIRYDRVLKKQIQEFEAQVLKSFDAEQSSGSKKTPDEPRKACLFMDSLKDTKIPIEDAEVLQVSVLGLERAKLVAMYPVYDTTGEFPASYRRFLDMPTELLQSLLQLGNWDLGLKISEDEINVVEGILSDRGFPQIKKEN